jgi:NTE family protein
MKKNQVIHQPAKRIGLALGGGGAKGLAHIGVIKALEEEGLIIDFVAGTSMGALVGGWYAANRNIKFLENIFLKIEKENIFSEEEAKQQGGNLFRGKNFGELLEKILDGKTFSQCELPFSAVATNMENGHELDINEGELAEAIKASIALPIVFQPVKRDGQLLVDGAFTNPVPADVVREMGAEFVIAVDVSSCWVNIPNDMLNPKGTDALIRDAFTAIEYQLARKTLKQADVVIRPAVLTYDWLDFSRAKEIIKAGYKETKKQLDEIREKAGYPKKEPETIVDKIADLLDGN